MSTAIGKSVNFEYFWEQIQAYFYCTCKWIVSQSFLKNMALIINSVDSYEILSKLDFSKINIKCNNLQFWFILNMVSKVWDWELGIQVLTLSQSIISLWFLSIVTRFDLQYLILGQIFGDDKKIWIMPY